MRIGSLIARIADPDQIPFVLLKKFVDFAVVESLDKTKLEKMSGMTYFMFWNDIHEYRGRKGYDEDIKGCCTGNS